MMCSKFRQLGPAMALSAMLALIAGPTVASPSEGLASPGMAAAALQLAQAETQGPAEPPPDCVANPEADGCRADDNADDDNIGTDSGDDGNNGDDDGGDNGGDNDGGGDNN